MPQRHRLGAASVKRFTLTAITVVVLMTLAGSAVRAADNIDTARDFYLASNIGKSVNPDFKGGTLRIDQDISLSQNFAVEAVTGNTIDAFAHNATFSGILSGDGNIAIVDSAGGGIVTLTGVNTYTGATIISSGTLALSGTGSIASSPLSNQGTFDISGTTSSGTSIVSLTGANTTAQVLLGNQTLTLSNGSGNFAGVISGTGKLVLSAGTEYLTGANTYSGGTVVSGGVLYIGDGGTSGSVVGDILTIGTVAFNRSDTITLTNNITGSGAIGQAGIGTLIINTAQVYTGGTGIASGGTIALTGAGSVASSSLVTASGTFDVSGTNGDVSIKSLGGSGAVVIGSHTLSITTASSTFTGVISGTGGVVITGGTQTFSGTNTYTGGTTVTAGTLTLGAAGTTGSVIGNIVDNGTVAFNFSAATLGTAITGAGSVAQVGSGTTTLTSVQGYTGATAISSGTLALADKADISSSSGVVDNGTLDISAKTSSVSIATLSGSGRVLLGSQTLVLTGATGVFSGTIGGTGSLDLQGGAETVAGSNSYTGTTNVGSGTTLYLSSTGSIATSSRVTVDGTVDLTASAAANSFNSLAGSGTVALGSKTLTLANAADTFMGTLSGTGGIVLNAGNEIFSGNNVYLGSTVIYSGSLKLVGAGSIASSSSVQTYGTFDISGTTAGAQITSLAGTGNVLLGGQTLTITASTGTHSGVIAGTGGLVISSGTQILAGTNTYTGGTTISGGTLQIGAGVNNGSIVGDVTDNGTLAFNLANGSFSGIISGTGSVNQLTGSTILFAANTYSGGTTITDGTLQLGNGGTTGSIQGNVVDNGTLAFNRSDAVTFGGIISGTGGVSQKSAGTLTLTAANTYTGQTTIASGTLALTGNGRISDSSRVVDNGVLDLSALASGISLKSLVGTGTVAIGSQTLTLTSAAGSFTGTIAGSGGVILTGGTQTLGGDNTYTGLTQVNGGTLFIDGRTTATQGVTVASGATLGGTGTVASVTIANGGKISAGDNAIGTLHVNGNLQLGSGSITNVNVSPAGASEVVVTNAATLAGTVTVTEVGGFAVGQKWTVLTAAGGVSGNLTLATTKSAASNFVYALSQDAHNVYLQINLANLSSLLPSGATANERAVGGGIDAAIASGAALPVALEQLGNLSGTALTTTLDQLVGEVGAGVAHAGEISQTLFVAAMFDRMENAGLAGAAGAGNTWIGFFGDSGKIKGDTAIGSHAITHGSYGIAGGADWDVGKTLTAGAAFSYGRSTVGLVDNLGGGGVSAYQLGGYALIRFSPHLYGSLAVTLGAGSLHTRRVASTDTLQGTAMAIGFGTRYETGVRFSWGTPYAALYGNWFNTPAYDEDVISGPGTFALHYNAHTSNRTGAEFGLKETAQLRLAGGLWRLSGQLAWKRDFTNTVDAVGVFQQAAASRFFIKGARQVPNAVIVAFGTGYTTKDGIDLSVSFDSELARNSQSYAGIWNIAVRW